MRSATHSVRLAIDQESLLLRDRFYNFIELDGCLSFTLKTD
ncbi:MAG TPA: hypothetical protein V6C85_04040 [Allocoleopsis sp.]